MEVLSYSYAPCYDTFNLRWKLIVKSSSSHQFSLLGFRKNRVFGAKFDVRKKFLSCYNLDQPFLKQLNHQGGFRSLDTGENFKHVGPILSSGSSDGYKIKREENESISKTGEPVTKVLIPGLPDESKGESGAPINSCFWEWKPEFSVHYEKAGCETLGSLPVLFLPGFGVGSFHYEKQLKELGLDFRVRAKQLNGWCVYLYLDETNGIIRSFCKIGVYYGTPQAIFGGIALKFFASVRLEIRLQGR